MPKNKCRSGNLLQDEIFKIENFDFSLPKDLIAHKPSASRTESRLLHCKMFAIESGGEYINKNIDANINSNIFIENPSFMGGESFNAIALTNHTFNDLPSLLRKGDRLVINDSFVIPANFHGKISRNDDGNIRFISVNFNLIDCLKLKSDCDKAQYWKCLIKPKKKVRNGDIIWIKDDFFCTVTDDCAQNMADEDMASNDINMKNDGAKNTNEFIIIKFDYTKDDFLALVNKYGIIPLPQYIKRDNDEHKSGENNGKNNETKSDQRAEDKERYQNVYANEGLSVAAPTAGFHFDDELLDTILSMGVIIHRIRLDVGGGTFMPIRNSDIREHNMHRERYWIKSSTWNDIINAKIAGNRIIAVGTTALRTIESFRLHIERNKEIDIERNREINDQLLKKENMRDYYGLLKVDYDEDIILTETTNLFILPGFKFLIIDGLITNFHTPKSTLFVLICAMVGIENARSIYEYAVKNRYRFFSYGDSSFIEFNESNINAININAIYNQ